jgi:hypothetical protein
MRTNSWIQVLGAAAVITLAPVGRAQAQFGPPPSVSAFPAPQRQAEYNRGYERGMKEGQQDARKTRAYQSVPNGNGRNQSDINFREGFDAGYRAGYDQVRRQRTDRWDDRRDDRRDDGRDDRRNSNVVGRRGPAGYQEPAVSRGYSDGYQRGLDDSRNRRNYDPVGEKDYREADQGYYSGYGSKDAYKNNYRTGFRQGYEEGYRGANYRR